MVAGAAGSRVLRIGSFRIRSPSLLGSKARMGTVGNFLLDIPSSALDLQLLTLPSRMGRCLYSRAVQLSFSWSFHGCKRGLVVHIFSVSADAVCSHYLDRPTIERVFVDPFLLFTLFISSFPFSFFSLILPCCTIFVFQTLLFIFRSPLSVHLRVLRQSHFVPTSPPSPSV
ncbi:hypothetical protein GALMADRAFT_453971 [Galerina marginata CBS 339.88]|uniref:Transmembrane protein n=1 Tax=Galerina marginata (strain CBS 339.88) TaxID=685588 RepID=A0A067T0R9_GALM3|nr:hypothetical protein GALMADRAFT_453971 [Galerina marginata CBS 339.88]